MPPEPRAICRFAAEPPQEDLAQGRWAQLLRAEFLAACLRIDVDASDLGEVGQLDFHPDRTWSSRTYVPIVARTDTGGEVFGFVSFGASDPDTDDPPEDFDAWADFTDETADDHPEWRLDLNQEVVGHWRGDGERVAAMTLVWGRRLTAPGDVVTGELTGVTVDQCRLMQARFTLLAPDGYGDEYLEVALWDSEGRELARESLYEDDGEDEDADELSHEGGSGGDGGRRPDSDGGRRSGTPA
ncbi:MAG: hypothetical protein M3P40_03870 [Actinomycetota bacterium]|nr:hypothetical protein [Actinomycetota bacterium]